MKSERIINLENAYRSFCVRETFSPGDIVTWKNGMEKKGSGKWKMKNCCPVRFVAGKL